MSNSEKYLLIKNLNSEIKNLTVKDYCQILSLPRSCFYRFKHRPVLTAQDLEDFSWRYQIEKILLQHSCYGYRRVCAEIERQGRPANHKKILRLMRKFSLTQRRKIKFQPTGKLDKVYANLTADLKIYQPNQIWAADLTYIQTLTETLYLLAIIDCFTRKIIGWNLADNYEVAVGRQPLAKAIKRQKRNKNLINLIHHSDQGFPYRAKEYTKILQSENILISMSRSGTPTDNPYIESFFKTLKYDEVYLKEYQNFTEAYENINYFIEQDYNKKRLHSALNYLPPLEFERNYYQQNN